MNRFIKILLTCFLLLAAGAVTGCVDAIDINKKIIATTIAVDRRDGEIWFYVEIANIQASQGDQSSGGSAGDKYHLVKSHGKTLAEARENLDRQFDRPIFISSVRTLLLSEEFAKEDIVEYLYRLRADETYRKKVITIITRENLDELFKKVHEQSESVGYSVEHTIMTLDQTGESFSRSTSRLLENLSTSYTGILIPCIGLQDKEIALIGYSVVNDTKVIGFIPVADSKGLIMFKADKAKSHFIVPYKDLRFTIETVLQKRNMKASYQNGQISFSVELAFEAELMYGDKKTPYALENTDIEKMTELLKGMINSEVLKAIAQAQQEFKTDYLQMDDTFRIKYPVLFEKLDWQNEFPNASVSVNIEVDLKAGDMVDYKTNEMR